MSATHQVKVMGYHGPARAGKDTAIQLMIKNSDKFTLVAFSDAVYREVSSAFKVTESLLRDAETKDTPTPLLALTKCSDPDFIKVALAHLDGSITTPRTPREILQIWGTEYRRGQDPEYWIKILRDDLLRADVSKIYVISGVRYQNERGLVSEMNGFVTHIARPNAPQVRNHSSEIPLPKLAGDYEINNDGDLSALERKVAKLIEYVDWHFNKEEALVSQALNQEHERKTGPSL